MPIKPGGPQNSFSHYSMGTDRSIDWSTRITARNVLNTEKSLNKTTLTPSNHNQQKHVEYMLHIFSYCSWKSDGELMACNYVIFFKSRVGQWKRAKFILEW